MLSDATSIQLSGANFSPVTLLPPFETQGNKPGKYVKASLLYGRNGTGKSTIARAFRKVRDDDARTVRSAELLDSNGATVSVSDDEKARIFVFDEDFVEEKVKLRESNLDTIVMLGESKDVDERLEAAINERDSAKKTMEDLEESFIEYSDRNNPKSPAYYQDRMKSALQGDAAWAGRDKEIKGARRNTSVKEDSYRQFIGLSPSKHKDELLVDFRDGMERLSAARTGNASIDRMVPALPHLDDDYDDRVTDLLQKALQKPELSEREQFLLELVEKGQGERVAAIAEDFGSDGLTRCPHCLQTVTKDYRQGLVESVRKVLNKAVEEHRDALRQHLIATVDMDLSDYGCLGSFVVCNSLLRDLNHAILKCNDCINRKIDNPYEPLDEGALQITSLSTRLGASLASLERERVEFNRKATDVRAISKKLMGINADIAHYDVCDLAVQMETQERELKSARERLEKATAAYEDRRGAVDALEAEKRNVRIAVDSINSCMSYIFFSEDRLRVELRDGEYRLRSRGRSVRPRDVSVGERNILALSYFFTSILEGKEAGSYSDECLIVLDDPVSSYDLENKVGILSFLNFELGRYLCSNERTRVLVMTHDLGAVFDLEKTLKEVMDSVKARGFSKPMEYTLLELRDGQVGRFQYKSRQEYTELVEAVYEYACGQPSPYEPVIGNVMRQMLEAYARFEHRCSIETASTNEQVLNLLPEEEYRSYFRNLMYRLVLHGGSHRDEQVRAMADMRFFSTISETEKRRTARDILCFVFLLSEGHLCAHLQEIDRDARSKLQEWCDDVRARATVVP